LPNNSATPAFSMAWLSLFPPVYLVHLLDERFFGDGTAAWATAHMGVNLTNEAWLIINVVWFSGLSLVTWLVSQGRLPDWLVVSLATHLVVHSLTRVWGSAVFAGWSPGVLSGVTLCLPWAAVTIFRAYGPLSTRQLITGAVCGVLSLQPLWDFVMLPILSPDLPIA
jgi:hypothetical protein